MPFSMFGIEFAPLRIPLERRKQTAAVLYYWTEFFLTGPLMIMFLLYLYTTRFYHLVYLYLIWYIYDFQSFRKSDRRSEWLRKLNIWKHFANYFPIKLVKTAEISPDKNYIFACHPHGYLSVSHFANFMTDGTYFSDKYPDIKPHLMTLNFQFLMPLHREIILFSGARSASASSIEYILRKKEKGNAVAIVIGGAREVLDAIPNKMILILSRRKGFIRLAIKTGASLVPVISFGENDIFEPTIRENSWLQKKIQEFFIKLFTFPLPIFFGRGIFQYTFGLLPFRRKITTVVGKPIDVLQNENPSKNDIDDLHQRYHQELIKLFEEHKAKYSDSDTILKIR
ncbi:2-acylglycerol O-acyltransferase 2-A [Sarcoptes scabiei]|uniref:Acyltransferase n=1 Tax=Sarcoptes scabiei TaxID=52283 RepID=A0A834VBM5_SARSC|nr:2-acylglycerol O-acyltransferase 2-A [Sarcoptes scabiei]